MAHRLTNRKTWLLPIVLTLALCAEVAPDLSGTWKLDVQKSSWGKKPKPQSVMLTIEHHEPSFQYTGTVISGTAGEDTRRFQFAGAIDGKPYSDKGTSGPGHRTLKRVNPYTILEEFRSDDGKDVETTRDSVSKDGRTLTRRVVMKTSQGQSVWTEVYEKQ